MQHKVVADFRGLQNTEGKVTEYYANVDENAGPITGQDLRALIVGSDSASATANTGLDANERGYAYFNASAVQRIEQLVRIYVM